MFGRLNLGLGWSLRGDARPELFDPDNVVLSATGDGSATLDGEGRYVIFRGSTGGGSFNTGVSMLTGEQFDVRFTFHNLPIGAGGYAIYTTAASPFNSPIVNPGEGAKSYVITALGDFNLIFFMQAANRGAGFSNISIKKK